MSVSPFRRRAAAVLVALAAAACGPYANVAQKLDVTARVVGDTWIAAVGPDRSELRVLIVGSPQAEGSPLFSFSSVHVPLSRGGAVRTLQGTWTEVGNAGATTLHVVHVYTMADESGVPILSRRGSYRDDVQYDVPLIVTRAGGRLTVAGDPSIEATYVPLVEALGNLRTAGASDAACAFQVANLGMLTSQARIIGFGGPGITQYNDPETYIGTVAGSLRIEQHGWDPNWTVMQYSAFQDVGGVAVEGPMRTDADSGGNGHMSGVMTFAFAPTAPDGTLGTPITGTIDYGTENPANAIRISGGDATGGFYTVAIAGGGTALVPPELPPTPPLAQCLALP